MVKTQTESGEEGPPSELLDGEDQELSPDNLLLDPGNFRLIEVLDPKTHRTAAKLIGQKPVQQRVFRALVKSDPFDVRSLVKSIAFNGFLNHEKLIVAPFDSKRYLVLEGNRRLTAVMRLRTEESLRESVPQRIRQTYAELPCFVLEGDPIDGDEALLQKYRRHAAVYVGMRHLMRAKQWSPPARYEFQARLVLEEGWKIQEVADHFGSSRGRVTNEIRAQVLYHDFAEYSREKKGEVALTYNAFAEMAKSPDISRWLEWSTRDRRVENTTREHAVFDYLTSRLAGARKSGDEDSELAELHVSETAERIVRRLRDMLKLNDDEISSALEQHSFQEAEELFRDRRAGTASARIRECAKTLKRLTVPDLKQDAQNVSTALDRLNSVISDLKKVVESFLTNGE